MSPVRSQARSIHTFFTAILEKFSYLAGLTKRSRKIRSEEVPVPECTTDSQHVLSGSASSSRDTTTDPIRARSKAFRAIEMQLVTRLDE
jgi:hypothetical protein